MLKTWGQGGQMKAVTQFQRELETRVRESGLAGNRRSGGTGFGARPTFVASRLALSRSRVDVVRSSYIAS